MIFISRCLLESLWRRFATIILIAFALIQDVHAQDIAPSITFNPRHYICYKINDSLKIDGALKEPDWDKAKWTNDFVDIEGAAKPKPRYRTRVKMLWNDSYLYIAAQLFEPQIWANLKKRDAIIFHDNDFEVFIDPNGNTHNYYEFEINALNTFWDLMLTKPYRDGGRAIDSWDIRGLKSGIDINGTINNPTDTDSSWTVELALPWKVLEETAPEGRLPKDGEQWRINFSRVEWQTTVQNGNYKKKNDPDTGKPLSEDNWVWSPQGIVNMHYPEMWGFVQFSDKSPKVAGVNFERLNKEDIKWYLRQLYYREHEFRKKNDAFTSHLKDLKAIALFNEMNLDRKLPSLRKPVIHATPYTFEIMMSDSGQQKIWYIREDSKVWSEKTDK